MQEMLSEYRSNFVIITSDADLCTSNPCKNGGVCISGANGYVCDCFGGFEGVVCGVGKLFRRLRNRLYRSSYISESQNKHQISLYIGIDK